MKRLFFAVGIAICATAAAGLGLLFMMGDPAYFLRMHGPGTVAERLGRPVKWIHIDFEDGFFDDFDQLNISAELEPPWQNNLLADNDTIAISLPNWAEIDDLEGADHLPIPSDDIRALSDSEFLFLVTLRHDNPDGSFHSYFNLLFFNRDMVDRFNQPCRVLLVYEAVRTVAVQRDIDRFYESDAFAGC